jgi:hypothetical protein
MFWMQATRAMGLSRAAHDNQDMSCNFGNAEWRDYIRKEELIRYFAVYH